MSSVTEDRSRIVLQNISVTDIEPLALNSLQASRALSISERTLWGLTSPRGPIKAKKVGRLNLYPIAELTRFLNECAEPAANAG